MHRHCWFIVAFLLFTHSLHAITRADLVSKKLYNLCTKGDWQDVQNLVARKLKKNPEYPFATRAVLGCMQQAFAQNQPFLSELIKLNNGVMIPIEQSALEKCVKRNHDTVFRIALANGLKLFPNRMTHAMLFQTIRHNWPLDLMAMIFGKLDAYVMQQQQYPFSLEERSESEGQTMLGYSFTHQQFGHATLLLRRGANFINGLFKKTKYGSKLNEQTDWDNEIAALWFAQEDDGLLLLQKEIFNNTPMTGAFLVRFFLRAINLPAHKSLTKIASLFYYRQLVTFARRLGFKEALAIEYPDEQGEMREYDDKFYQQLTTEISLMTNFLHSFPDFISCKVGPCMGGAFSLHHYEYGSSHILCSICFEFHCIECGNRHPGCTCVDKRKETQAPLPTDGCSIQ